MNNLIVIAVYGDSPYLPNCIKSITENTDGDYKISVINTKEPRISLASAWNSAIKDDPDYEIITVLNDDTMVGKNWLKHLTDELLKDPKNGLVSPSVSFCGNGYQTEPFKLLSNKKIEEYSLDDVNNISDLIYANYNGISQQCGNEICGSCMTFRRSTWESVKWVHPETKEEHCGFYEPAFPAYAEDNIFEDEIMSKGFKLIWVLYAFVLHYGGKTALRIPDLNRTFTTNLYLQKRKELKEKRGIENGKSSANNQSSSH